MSNLSPWRAIATLIALTAGCAALPTSWSEVERDLNQLRDERAVELDRRLSQHEETSGRSFTQADTSDE